MSHSTRRVLFRVRILLAAAFLLWAGLSADIRPLLADWRSVASRGVEPDLVTHEDQRYAVLVSSLPTQGTVGYLPPRRWPAADEVQRFYLAQYALTPRIVAIGTAPELVIVVPEPEGADHLAAEAPDPRLAGFALYQRFDNGLRIFRRIE